MTSMLEYIICAPKEFLEEHDLTTVHVKSFDIVGTTAREAMAEHSKNWKAMDLLREQGAPAHKLEAAIRHLASQDVKSLNELEAVGVDYSHDQYGDCWCELHATSAADDLSVFLDQAQERQYGDLFRNGVVIDDSVCEADDFDIKTAWGYLKHTLMRSLEDEIWAEEQALFEELAENGVERSDLEASMSETMLLAFDDYIAYR